MKLKVSVMGKTCQQTIMPFKVNSITYLILISGSKDVDFGRVHHEFKHNGKSLTFRIKLIRYQFVCYSNSSIDTASNNCYVFRVIIFSLLGLRVQIIWMIQSVTSLEKFLLPLCPA